jgi:hypothetical protein
MADRFDRYQGRGRLRITTTSASRQTRKLPKRCDVEDYGLRTVQLKRALRGAAFARGALFPLRSILSEEQFEELFRVLKQMETDIIKELGKVRLM